MYLPRRRITARSHCRAIFGDCANSNPNSPPTIAPPGFKVQSVVNAPSAIGVTSASTATRGFIRPGADKSADATARLQNSGAFQFGVHLGHGIGVNAQIDRQLPYRRQLIPDAQLSSRNREANGLLELRIKRRRVVGVD